MVGLVNLLKMSKYECEKCGVSFTRSYSLLRHKRESCIARFDRDVVGVDGVKRCKIDGAASTSMETCAVCNVAVPRNQMSAHQRTLTHKSKSCVRVCDGVQITESAFKNRIVSYRVSCDTDHVDYSVFFNDIKVKVLDLVKDKLQLEQSLKINMVIVARYFLPSQEIYSDKSFNTCNQIVTVGSDLDDIYHSFVEAMKVQTADFQEKDSGRL